MSDIASLNAVRRVPLPVNEPINSYAPGTPQRAELKARLASMSNEHVEIPLIIGGKEVRTSKTFKAVMPFDHGHVLATVHSAEPQHVQVHRWRYAKTEVALGRSHLWDARARIGLGGDWCLGHRVEHAFVSGLELALRVSGHKA